MSTSECLLQNGEPSTSSEVVSNGQANNGLSGSQPTPLENGSCDPKKLTTRTVTTTSLLRTTKRSKSNAKYEPEEHERDVLYPAEDDDQRGFVKNGVARSQSCGKISKQLRFAEPLERFFFARPAPRPCSPRSSDFTWEAIAADAKSNLVLRAGKGLPKIRHIDLTVEGRDSKQNRCLAITSKPSSSGECPENGQQHKEEENGHATSSSDETSDNSCGHDRTLIVTHVYTSEQKPQSNEASYPPGLESKRCVSKWKLSWKQTVRWSQLENDCNVTIDGVSRLRVRQETIDFHYNIYFCFQPKETQV